MTLRRPAVLFERVRESVACLRTRCSRFFRSHKHEAAVNAEFEFHLDQLTAEYRNAGMSEVEARAAAQRDFGSVVEYRDEVREIWRAPNVTELWRNFRLGSRSLAKQTRG